MTNDNSKEFGVHLLTQLFQPQSGLIVQQGDQWKLAAPIQGIDAIKNRSFRSPVELMQAIVSSNAVEPIVSYYYQQFSKTSNVTGLRSDTAGQEQTATKKAV